MNTNIYLYVDLQELSDILDDLRKQINRYFTNEQGIHQMLLDFKDDSSKIEYDAFYILREARFRIHGCINAYCRDIVYKEKIRFQNRAITNKLNMPSKTIDGSFNAKAHFQQKRAIIGNKLKKIEMLSFAKLLISADQIYEELDKIINTFDIYDHWEKFKACVNDEYHFLAKDAEDVGKELSLSYEGKVANTLSNSTDYLMWCIHDFFVEVDSATKAGLIKELDRK